MVTLSAYSYTIAFKLMVVHFNADSVTFVMQPDTTVMPMPKARTSTSALEAVQLEPLPVTAIEIKTETKANLILHQGVLLTVLNGWGDTMPKAKLKHFYHCHNELSHANSVVFWGL